MKVKELIRMLRGLEDFDLKDCGITTEMLDALDAQPVVHGHWIYAEGVHVYGVNSDIQLGSYRCSACGNCSPHITNYCPICGADLRGTDDDNA